MKWIHGKEVHEENDAHTEFRPLTEIQSLTFYNIVKTMGSFLNARLKGRILLGIYGFPVKLVHGFTLDEKQRQDVEEKVFYALHHRFSPSVPSGLIKIKFEPVFQEQLVFNQNVPAPMADVFVIEMNVGVEKDPATFYKVLDDNRYHYREGASILPLKNKREVVTFRDRDERQETERKMGIYSSEPTRHLEKSSTTTNLPFDKFGSKRMGRSKIQNAKIDSMRAYVQGESCRFLSDTTHEIRLEDNVDATSESAMANNINAFLNSGLGGSIYYGFVPEGPQRPFAVRGLILPRDKRDQFRLGVDDVINRFRPRPHHARIAVDYVPVLTRDRKTVPDLYMIEVKVEPQSSTVYFTADFRIYSRNGPNNIQVHVQQIRDMVIQERIDAWKAELTGRREKDESAKTTPTTLHECRVDDLLMLTEEEEAAAEAAAAEAVEVDRNEREEAAQVDRDDPEEAVEEKPKRSLCANPNREEVEELKSEMKKKDEEIEKLKIEIAKLKIESVQND